MSKKKKTNNTPAVTPEQIGTIEIADENVTYDELEAAYVDLAKDIIEMQTSIVGMVEAYGEEKFSKDPELALTTKGLINSLKYLAEEAKSVRDTYNPNGVNMTGVIAEDDPDALMAYVKNIHEYTNIRSKYAGLACTATMDIAIRLEPDSGISEKAAELKQTMDDFNKGETNGGK